MAIFLCFFPRVLGLQWLGDARLPAGIRVGLRGEQGGRCELRVLGFLIEKGQLEGGKDEGPKMQLLHPSPSHTPV